jgi:hypothetical protein
MKIVMVLTKVTIVLLMVVMVAVYLAVVLGVTAPMMMEFWGR